MVAPPRRCPHPDGGGPTELLKVVPQPSSAVASPRCEWNVGAMVECILKGNSKHSVIRHKKDNNECYAHAKRNSKRNSVYLRIHKHNVIDLALSKHLYS